MASTYTRDPNSLDVLKKYLLPGTGDAVSEDVLTNDPELALPQARRNADFAGNEHLKQVLGLGPSRALQEQRNQLTAQDQAVNQARIAANPEVSREADLAHQEKMALAGEPNRITGQNQLALQQDQQRATKDLIGSMGSGSGGGTGAPMRMSINAKGEPTFAPPAAMGQQEQALVDSAHQISALGGPLLQKFEAKYPGIANDPRKYGNVLADTLAPKIGKAAYMFGGMTDNDALMQESAAIQAWGVRALAGGRITKPLMDMISAHLPQPGFSAGANYDRLKRLMTEVLPAQLQGIGEGHGANALTLPQGSDQYANPEWGR
jgi:hypothetical protein